MNPARQNEVIRQIKLGRLARAKQVIEKGCKTKPQELAYRLARVCCAMVDHECRHFSTGSPDLSKEFMEMFKP